MCVNIERNAFLLAYEQHKHQKYDDKPYLVHLYDVAQVLVEFGHGENDWLMAAAWLHDIIEDTPCNYHNVKEATCIEVADIVLAVTDEVARNRRERKEWTLPKIKANYQALTLKLADWIANVRNAIATDNKLMHMFKKEYPDFREFLYRGDDAINQDMWRVLDHLTNEEM